MKKLPIILLIILSSCTYQINNFDSNEYRQVVNLQILSAKSAKLCNYSGDFPTLKNNLIRIRHHLETLELYSSGKTNNDKTIQQIELLIYSLKQTQTKFKKKINQDYCRSAMEDLTFRLNLLREALGNNNNIIN